MLGNPLPHYQLHSPLLSNIATIVYYVVLIHFKMVTQHSQGISFRCRISSCAYTNKEKNTLRKSRCIVDI